MSSEMTIIQQLFIETEMIARAAVFGLPVTVDPDVADYMGAFDEAALDDEEAEESGFDVDPETGIVIDDSEEGSVDHGQA